MEHRVDRAHGVGKAECEGMRTRMHNDIIWTEVLFGELLGWSSCLEELGFNEDLVTNCKLWSGESTQVSRLLIMALCLCDFSLEHSVEVVKIDCELAGTLQSKIAFRVDSDIGMITLISKEWRDTSGS
jgi:hypothetical protein